MFRQPGLHEKLRSLDTVLAIDIGGTGFRSVLLDRTEQAVFPPKISATPNYIMYPDLPVHELQNVLLDKIETVIKDYERTYKRHFTVGISFAAAMTPDGLAYNPCGIWGDKGNNYPLKLRILERMPELKFCVAHDVTAAAERYAKKYTAYRYFQVITISSGIGSIIYDTENNKAVSNNRGNGGDIGHVKMDFSDNAPICGCGKAGHLEALASGRAVEALTVLQAKKYPEKFRQSVLYSQFKNTPDEISNHHMVAAIRVEDAFCTEILDRSTFYLAQSIAHAAANVGIDKFIIIGGFAIALGGHYLQSINRNLEKVDFVNRTPEEILGMVEMGNPDGYDCLIGAGIMAQNLEYKKILDSRSASSPPSKGSAENHALIPCKL